MKNVLDPSAQEFYPRLLHPIPQIYYPTTHPTYYAPPPQATTDAAASRAVVLSTVPRHATEPSIIQSMAAFGGVRSIDTGFLLREGIVTVHFYDLRRAEIAVAEIREQHLRQQSRLGQQYLYGGVFPPPLPENFAAAALPFGRGLIDGQAIWAQFAAENLDVLNQGSLFVSFSDPAISSENVRDIFQNFGSVKEVRESPTKPRHKIVEFFDVRDAARALNELNGKEIGGRRFSVEFYRAGHDQFSRSYRLYQKRSGQQNLSLPPRLVRNHDGERGAPVLKMSETKFSNVSKSGKDSNDGVKRNKGSMSSTSDPSLSLAASSSSKQHQQHQLSKKEWKRNKNYSNRRDIDASRFQFKEGDYESGSSSSAASSCRDSRTTVMIKNIPNKYSQNLLLNMLDSHCIHCNEQIGDGGDEPLSAYDFVYLPIDFSNKCNVGYGFVNLTSPEATVRLYKTFHLQPWEVFNSRKICEVTYARLQGLEALKEHFKNSKFACDVDEYLPAVFEPPRDGRQLTNPLPIGGRGSGQAYPPHGVKIRAGRDRGYGGEGEGGDSSSIDDTCGGISNLEL